MSAAIIVPITLFVVLIVSSWFLGKMGIAVLEERRKLQK